MSVMSSQRQRRVHWALFFFSSRRRHTRYIGDWSSDVCSSDQGQVAVRPPRRGWTPSPARALPSLRPCWRSGRSEERRVGKECRSRWSPDHKEKKETGYDAREISDTNDTDVVTVACETRGASLL